MKNRQQIRIGIIDSGLSTRSNRLGKFVEKGLSIKGSEIISDVFDDEIGHGTACADLLTRYLSPEHVRIYIYKIFDAQDSISFGKLNDAFRLALKDEVDLINCSFGSIDPGAQSALQEQFDAVTAHNIIVVCAWNEYDYTTWPANFEKAISVKGGEIASQNEWHWENNKRCHVIFRGNKQRVKWRNNKQIFIGGSSFATVLCTRQIIQNWLTSNTKLSYQNTVAYLKKHAVKTISVDLDRSDEIPWNSFQSKIRNVGIYPFYKESHGFVHFADKLPYSISWVADLKFSKNSGKSTHDVLKNCDRAFHIHQGLPEDAGDIDTLIVGYLDKASRAQGRNLLESTLRYALRHKKNVFSFLPPDDEEFWVSSFSKEDLWLKIPKLTQEIAQRVFENVPEKRAFDTPIVCVIGTSSQQGKFTLQLALRYELQNRNLRVAQIGTEHQSGCFGIDFTFPSGYGHETSLNLPMHYHIPFLRRVLSEMDKENHDVILTGAQSGLLSPDPYSYHLLFSELFFLAVIPDHTIVIYNKTDPPDLIERTRKYVESKTSLPPFAMVAFEELVEKGFLGVAEQIVDRLLDT